MRVFCLSLGCAKNQVDSECLAGALTAAGHVVVECAEDADCAIVNTCGFIRPAVEESISALLDLEELKKGKKLKKIGVVGCLVNRYGEDLLSKEVPTVDFWAKSEEWGKVLASLGTPLPDARRRGILPSVPKFSRYLKISEGCDNRCTYCAIPSIRGSLRSLPMSVIVDEACGLAENGAKEICVVGQDLTSYGMDFGGKENLLTLLDELERSLPKDIWLRLLYLHPERVNRHLLERVAAGRQIVPYLDVPVQHGDETILTAMNRAMDPKRLLSVFAEAREINPEFALRTTCMVGFPGEKKKHFDNLVSFIREAKFDRMGAFTFFAEEGTKAAEMENKVSERTKLRRLDTLMTVQEEISLQRQEIFVGKRLKVLVEKVNNGEGYAEGRSFREAPDVDGVIEISEISDDIREGDFVTVKITGAMPHDLTGEIADDIA
ncbi:MAG: 30S ribosomal protein S12 methylthiotransferase RimO [Synergistes sp.]|nr:30S ribosomal protein S12 methylthiotransferase RimO [Synergistes sp.]